ncbi:SRPBCC family protein [Ohtaekwangia kribbensis]|jgi:uncharacterized protein YndB with AHSA1/START domain|uniref:SRPBCC family protein n=1 Tax=Ohtaekwangia kribbensis TaxID=688913 RepID=A0ABW3K7I3_9BACT
MTTTTKNQLKVVAEPGKQELFIYREFDAPREDVFKAFTDPKLVTQWLGPHGLKMEIEKYDIRTGGSYRYTHADANGKYVFNGAVHEVHAPERIIQTFEFEGLPERGHVSLDIALFEALPGNRTRVTMQSVFRSVTDRDGMVQSGMERGVREGFERLDALLDQ